MYFAPTAFSKSSINLLQSISNNLYFGFSYRTGEQPIQKHEIMPGIYEDSVDIQEFKRTRMNEYFGLRTQYFFFGNIYGSINFGLNKAYKEEQKNQFLVQGNNIDFKPYQKVTTFSDRYSASLGIGYRKEVFDFFIIGTEFEYGILSTRRVNEHYSFNPQYFYGLPDNYVTEQVYLREKNQPSRDYISVSLYAGIAL
ncbi:hypothetical protein [Leptospira vanthielii]|uniref:Outer membrane protein, TIGR04327 family n=1 Tax=Leptospira vanthielii serovar Holland str. Waz Holland = ATCC 700522 TaxID=1218591 RepID=N1W437_9LEPT|nr:hypothetical protein [Leptospira vanthielii]EMY69773.1 hypothetical protein LEP1GSC199_1633 [Leptospira vanthielii serovar Holland str. Waz Holland = ATCC 700522]